jgi:hypothetical protein
MNDDMTLDEFRDLLPKGSSLIMCSDEGKPLAVERIGEEGHVPITESELKTLQDEMDWSDRQQTIEEVYELLNGITQDMPLAEVKVRIDQAVNDLWEFIPNG